MPVMRKRSHCLKQKIRLQLEKLSSLQGTNSSPWKSACFLKSSPLESRNPAETARCLSSYCSFLALFLWEISRFKSSRDLSF